jgi:hypothetical protein
MKSILTTLFMALTLIGSFAQGNADQKKHMTFKGIPIDGTLDEFVLKMKKNGFSHIE